MAALFGLSLPELTERMTALRQKPFRARQLWDALYRERLGQIEEITTLSADLRARLKEHDTIGLPEIIQTATSVDGTERYLVRMADGETVETVWMPDGDGAEAPYEDAEAEAAAESRIDRNAARHRGTPRGSTPGVGSAPIDPEASNTPVHPEARVPHSSRASGAKGGFQPSLESTTATLVARRLPHGANAMRPKLDTRNYGALAAAGYRRATICVSSQVGCAVNCQFCLTAKLGIKRNLTPGEIAGQVAAVLNRHRIQVGKDRINLVFMGMGEPFLNYDNFMAAVRLLVEGVGLPESRMTVSTSGIEPAIRRFAQEPLRPRLALSLNASNDMVREEVMPITRKWNIAQLLAAVQTIPLGKRDWVTFEYVLLGGINDRPQHAQEVLDLLHNIPSKVNLIVWNPGPGIAYTQPLQADVDRFQKALIAGGIPTYIRRPRGRDIYAACGQLKRTVTSEAAAPALVTLTA